MCEHCHNEIKEEAATVKEAGFNSGHHRTPNFNRYLDRLNPNTQELAMKSYERMLGNPQQVGLKYLPSNRSNVPVYSAQVGSGHRALALKVGNQYVWYWIGSHEEYNRVKDLPPGEQAIRKAQEIMQQQQRMTAMKEYFNLVKESQNEPPYIPEGVAPNTGYQQMMADHAKNPTRCSKCGEVMDYKNVLNPSHPSIYECHKCKHRFNPDNEKFAQTEPPHRGILPPKDNNTPWLTNQEPTPPPPISPLVGQGSGDGKDGICPKCKAKMEFGDAGWYCENCNEVFAGDPNKCPKCGIGEMSDWEQGETDAWDWGREQHFTKPSGMDYRVCENCGYEEEEEHYDPREDPDYQYEMRRDMEDNRNATGDNITDPDILSSSGGAKKDDGLYFRL